DLDTAASELTDFRHGEVDEILPIGGPISEPKPSCSIAYSLIIQTPAAYVAKKMMNLVNSEDGSSRVVDCRGKPLGSDVHNHAKGKGRVQLQSPLLTQRDRLIQGVRRQAFAPVENEKQRVAGGDKIAHLRHQL